MATTSTITQRAERDIDALARFIDDLPEISDEWDGLEESEQVSLSLDWAHLMADYLTELDEYFRGGQLTRDQEERYRSLLGKLKDVRPIIQQLRLYPPPVALDAVTLT